jgi:hemerythrin-like metal-binding protein
VPEAKQDPGAEKMSDYFEWNPAKLDLKIPAMDAEHQVLIRCMNKLHQLHVTAAPAAVIGKAMSDLIAYTAKHFADEEAYMESIQFPGLRTHKGVHKQLLQRLDEFQQTFQATAKLPEDVFMFFRMWLSAHICGIDSKYAQHSRLARAG